MTSRIEKADRFIASLGFEAYRVGGSVRDEVIGRVPKDADYVVRGVSLRDLGRALHDAGAKPSELTDRRKQHLGYRANVRGMGLVEIVLPRKEVSTGPLRKDFDIVVDPSLTLAEDAIRRDFTFNTLYKSIHGGPDNIRYLTIYVNGRQMIDIVDPLDCALYDLAHRRVAVTYRDSFHDDPLRVLRALRFVSTLDADLDPATRVLMEQNHDVSGMTEKGVSSTVLDELKKLLMGQKPAKALRIARDTGVLANVLPELGPMIGFEQGSRYHDMTTDEHTFVALQTAANVDAPLRVRMALLFHDSGKPASSWLGKDGRWHYYATEDAPNFGATEDHEVVGARIWRATAKRLNAERALRDDVETLIRNHMVALEGKLKPSKVRRERVRLGDDMLRDLYLHRLCDLTGKGKPNVEHMRRIGDLEEARAHAYRERVPAGVKDLAITGGDIKALGVDGRDIGRIQRALLDEVVVSPDDTRRSREWQLERAVSLAHP